MAARNKGFRVSLSVSPFIEKMADKGVRFTDESGEVYEGMEGVTRLFMNNGATEIFARIATAKKKYGESSNHSLTAGLERARLAGKLGLYFNPEINPFHFYGDVGGQPGPNFDEYPEIKLSGGWFEITLDEMCEALHKFGRAVAREIINTGADVNVWDIGNEVNFGIAGVALSPSPDGFAAEHGEGWNRPAVNVDPEIGNFAPGEGDEGFASIDFLKEHIWPHEAKLINAMAEGIKTEDKAAVFSTHIATVPFTAEFAREFFVAMQKGGFGCDVAGLSFYPNNPMGPEDRLGRLFECADAIKDSTGLPVIIAEYAYPAAIVGNGFFAGWKDVTKGYPISPEGQSALLRDLCVLGAEHGINGVRPWAPDLLSPGWAEGSFFELDDKTMMATARPCMYVMRDLYGKGHSL